MSSDDLATARAWTDLSLSTFRQVAASILALLGVALMGVVPALGEEPSLITIKVGAPVGAVPGVKAGIEAGYFRDEGIAVQFVNLPGGPNILAATVGGSIDVAYSDMFAWAGAQDNGFELEFLQSANRRNPDYLIAGPTSGIKTPQDLRGKKIGVAAYAQSKLRVTLYLEKFGLKASDVSFITINQRDTIGAAVSTGQVDAAISADPDVAVWEQQYKVFPLEGRPWLQIPEGVTTAGFFATPKWLAVNPKLAEGFVRAARKGAALYNSSSAIDKAKIALKYDKFDLFTLDKDVPGVIDRLNEDRSADEGPVDVQATTDWLQNAKDHGIIKKVIDLKPHLYSTATAPRV